MIGHPSWLNKPNTKTIPDWIAAAMEGDRGANGTFLLNTKRGQQHVHVGYMVFSRGEDIYSCHPSEVKTVTAEIDAEREIVVAERAERAARPAWNAKSVPNTATNCRSLAASGTTGSTYPKPLGMPPSIENRHPDELRIDDSYQRSIETGPSRALIEGIARGWDWRMCLPLVVSKRDDGGLYVIDGQHRLAAAQQRGDIQFLPCCVAVYGSVADEAAMFVAMNRSRRAINRLDDFHAAQASGNEEALAVAALVESVGFKVSRKTGSAAWVPGEVAFTSAIAGIRRKHGDGIVREALQAMAEAFPDERLVAGSSVFTAICRILVTPPPDFDKDRLFKALLTFDMKGWADFLAKSKGGDERAQRLREALLMAYQDAEVPT